MTERRVRSGGRNSSFHPPHTPSDNRRCRARARGYYDLSSSVTLPRRTTPRPARPRNGSYIFNESMRRYFITPLLQYYYYYYHRRVSRKQCTIILLLRYYYHIKSGRAIRPNYLCFGGGVARGVCVKEVNIRFQRVPHNTILQLQLYRIDRIFPYRLNRNRTAV